MSAALEAITRFATVWKSGNRRPGPVAGRGRLPGVLHLFRRFHYVNVEGISRPLCAACPLQPDATGIGLFLFAG